MAEAMVRTASAADAPDIARIQLETWRTGYADLLPADALDRLAGDDAERVWARAIDDDTTTVFVATEGKWTVGFCVVGPAPRAETAAADGTPAPDATTTAMIGTLLVEPRWGRRGHGGRLLVAAAEAARKRDCTRGIAWVPEADDASLGLYANAGWQPDGTVRTLDAAGTALRELRVTGSLDLKLTDESQAQ
ncbi:MAG: GNAT family N-acetyltransferase [Sciscionella sp.]|nr:GNAT family N-acetyltransferase [Sciscionella sp.]